MPIAIIPASALAPGTAVVGYGRVSEWSMVSNGELHRQERAVWALVKEAQLRAKAWYFQRERGKLSDDRQHLLEALQRCREKGAGLLAWDIFRVLKAESFDKVNNCFAVPTVDELAELLALADGVPFIATIIPPDTPPVEVKSIATKRGMAATGNMGGRPSSVSARLGKRIEALHRAGLSIREIAHKFKRYGVSKSAVDRFLKSVGG